MKRYWVSSRLFTCLVTVNERGVVAVACPFLKKFIGQPFDRLRSWPKCQPIEVEEI